MKRDPKVGDTIVSVNASSLIKRAKVTHAAGDMITAQVTEGFNKTDPLHVLRRGFFLYAILGNEEGDDCNRCDNGIMGFRPVENCYCHSNPPCSACTDNPLVCLKCGANPDDDE